MAMTMDEQSNPLISTTPCRSSNSTVTLEIIIAAETLLLLSRATVSNSSSAAINYSRNNNNKNNKNVTNKKVTFRLQSHRPVALADKKRKKRDDDVVVNLEMNSAASCSDNVSDELNDLKLNQKKLKLKHIEIDDSSTTATTSTTAENNVKKVIKNKHPVVIQGPNPPPDLPDNIKSIIHDMKGTDILIITQKCLTATDVNSHNNRLQIPLRQIINATFLTDQETQYLTEKDANDHLNSIETLLIDPALNQHKISMRRWLMCKKLSKTKSENYVLNKPWSQIVHRNGLKEGNLVQLWGFRVGQQLHLVLLKLPS